jgi:predicted O-methyltransferase YrrM
MMPDNPQAEAVLREIEVQAPANHWPIIGPVKGSVLVDLIRERQPKRVLELGALVGYSSTLMALHLPEGGRIVSVEVDPANVERSRATHERAGVTERCEVIQGAALETIPRLTGPWDMVFIDAEKSDYLRYLQAVEPELAPDAVVVADNVKIAAEAVAPYLDYVRNSGRYESSYHEFGEDAVEVSRRKPAG